MSGSHDRQRSSFSELLCGFRVWRVVCWFVTLGFFASAASSIASFQEFSVEFDAAVKTAFQQSHDGWSVDEVLIDDERRQLFLKACRTQPQLQNQDIADGKLFERLVQIRKSGKLDVKATKRASPGDKVDVDDWLPVAEIASRRMQDQFNANIDQWLISPNLLNEFDTLVSQIVPDADQASR